MNALFSSFNAVGLILLLIVVGFVAGKTKLVRSEHKSFIVNFLMHIAVPAMCISNVFEKFGTLGSENLFLLFLPPIISMLATLVIALVAAKLFRISRARFGAFVVMCAFSNSMFIGLPMCKELFGENAVSYVILFYIVNTMMFWTIGTYLIQRSATAQGEKVTFLQRLKKLATPPLISLIVAIILLQFNLKLPHILLSLCTYLGDTVTPLALLYIGYTISTTRLDKNVLGLSFCFVPIMRFVIAPLICIGLCMVFKISEMATNVFVIESAMPVMTQCVIVSAAYGGDESFAASAMTVSTALCLVAIPIWMIFLV